MKHIKICYLFVTDSIQKGEILVEWCSTNDINDYLFTKPNQGSLLLRFRDMIIGVMLQPEPGIGNPNGELGDLLIIT